MAVNAIAAPFKSNNADYLVLSCIAYTDPEITVVGLNETDAREQCIAHDITRYDLDDLDRTIADGVARGFVKILTPPDKSRFLGQIIAELVLTMKHNTEPRKTMQVVHSYPK